MKLDDSEQWEVDEVHALARAIRGHPTIGHLEEGERVHYVASDALYPALPTLLALESVDLSNRRQHAWLEDEDALARPESLTELLRLPSLRSFFLEFLFHTRYLSSNSECTHGKYSRDHVGRESTRMTISRSLPHSKTIIRPRLSVCTISMVYVFC
jgi:hypothetical protein